jgi:toxin YoeB
MQPASQPEAVFHPEFRKDLEYFVIYQRKVAKKAFKIVEAILRDPFNGQGKPKPLKHFGSNVWSRNLTQEDRIVYRVEHGRVEFLQCRFHYSQ